MKKSWDPIRIQESVVLDSLKTQPYDNQNPDMNKRHVRALYRLS